MAELQAEQRADEHAAAATLRRYLAEWRCAVREGRAALAAAAQQAATWGKINGWLAEVAARQQTQGKVWAGGHRRGGAGRSVP